MNDLARWLNAQLDEDDRIARAAAAMTFGTRWLWDNDHGLLDESDTGVVERVQVSIGQHIAAWDPARVLRETETKRLLIKAWASMLDVGPDIEGGYIKPCRAALAAQARNFLIVLSMPYADRPGYAEAIASVD